MPPLPILRITDGTDTIDFLSPSYGFHLKSWTPAVAEPKAGGVFASSSLLEGRRLVQRVYDNVAEAMTLALNAPNQDTAIWYMQELRRLLTKAHQYWTTEWQSEPVWIEVRAAYETNIRYATIVDWRLPADGNPFSQPFFSSKHPVIDELDLALERDHWQDYPINSSECVAISSIDSSSLYTSIGPFYPSANSDDAYVNHNTTTIYLIAACDVMGGNGTDYYDALILFQNVTAPAGAEITSAYIKLTSCGDASGDVYLLISGEKNISPATFSTYANYIARTKTNATGYWLLTDNWTIGASYNTPDLSNIVQEIIDLPSWASGNDMAFFLRGSKFELYSRIISNTDPGTEKAELYITYRTGGYDAGQEETCTPYNVFVASKQNTAQLTNVYLYENGVGYTDLLAESLPYDLLPGSAASGDYLYIGVDSSVANGGPFCSVIFDLSQELVGATGSWQYTDSATPTWASLTVKDNTSGLTETGINGIFFNHPSDWTPAPVNGVTAYWIRFTISSGTSTQEPTQQNRHPYSVIKPYFDIADDIVDGDISSLIRLTLLNRSYGTITIGQIGGIHISTRSLDRGEDFSAYFNASDEQHQYGVSLQDAIGSTNVGDDLSAPTGRSALYNPTNTETIANELYWTISNAVSDQYLGRYKAFLRYRQSGGSDGDFTARLAYKMFYSAERYTPVVAIPKQATSTRWAIVELGQVVFPPAHGLDVDSIFIFLQLGNSNASPGDLYICDLILMPYDEWTGDFSATDLSNALSSNEALRIDAIGVPKDKTRAFAIDADLNNRLTGYWSAVENGIPAIVPRKNIRVWTLAHSGFAWSSSTYSSFVHNLRVDITKVLRYLSMRGNR